MCCCAILFPIVWSIKHLRQAAQVDGKAQVQTRDGRRETREDRRVHYVLLFFITNALPSILQVNLAKLQLFRQFYVMVVAYIYFTRIVVYLLEATIPFYMLWLGTSSYILSFLIRISYAWMLPSFNVIVYDLIRSTIHRARNLCILCYNWIQI